MKIYRWFEFDAAHKLNDAQLTEQANTSIFGACNRLHGHSYKLKVILDSNALKNGMIMNYKELDKIVKPLIEKLDHKFLNENVNFLTTTENLIYFIWKELKINLPDLYELELKESEKTGCIYNGEIMFKNEDK